MGAAIGACGPELDAPGPGDVSGTWTAAGPAAGLTDITLRLTQSSDGSVNGTYEAVGTRGLQTCPPTGPCNLSSTVGGVHTVLQVNLDFSGNAVFTGQLIDPTHMRGTMTRSISTLVEFTKLEAIGATQ